MLRNMLSDGRKEKEGMNGLVAGEGRRRNSRGHRCPRQAVLTNVQEIMTLILRKTQC